MRGEVAMLIDQGKTHDEVIQWFVTTYGSEEMLGAPLNKGFSRLAWLFPYLIGATSAVAIGFAAVKWTRHLDIPSDAPAPADTRIEERLDDELRNLD
jgi:cytochrome c-type biogenesis protein CcmH/NrfF